MIRNALHFKCRTIMLLMAVLMLASLKPATAQDVVGVSEILSSTNSSEIDTYSATDLSYAVSLYYGAYVEGRLYDNSTLIAEGSAQAQQDAYGYMSKPLKVGDIYTIESDHYLVASFAYSADGSSYYDNPDYFDPGNDGGPTDPSGSSFSEGGGPEYIETEYLYLGTTGVQISSAQPSINSISPNIGSTGTSGTITVKGNNLVDPFTGSASPSITGSGVTLTPSSSSTGTQVNLNYSIDQGAATGNRSLTLQDRFGTSNAETFTVAYPPAVVTSISPSTWTAGQTTSVTITGTGFGTAPTISVTGSGVALTLNSASPDGTTIHATATVSATASLQSVTVQVTPGYTGNSFTCNCQGQPPDGTDTATIQPIAPPPQIMFNGQNISGTTQTVLAGQKIVLSVATPSGYSIQSQSWSFSHQSAITGGFTNTAGNGPPSASGGGVEAADPPLNQNSLTFYWVDPGDNGETVTCNYTLTNGASGSATATFNINGPTGNLLPTATMLPNNQAVQIITDSDGADLSLTGSSLPGYSNGNMGIVFSANATVPSANPGAFIWVQIVTSDQSSMIDRKNGSIDCPATPASGLDNAYPYLPAAQYVSDSPYSNLEQYSDGEYSRSFSATMYLMWDPALPSGCTTATPSNASTCTSIPIPLGKVNWHFSGCAINTKTSHPNGTTWSLQCGVGAPSAPESSGFPEWTNAVANGEADTCGPHSY